MLSGSHGNYARRSDIQAEERKEWVEDANIKKEKCSRLEVECHLVRFN